jgi:hypothetical protein
MNSSSIYINPFQRTVLVFFYIEFLNIFGEPQNNSVQSSLQTFEKTFWASVQINIYCLHFVSNGGLLLFFNSTLFNTVSSAAPQIELSRRMLRIEPKTHLILIHTKFNLIHCRLNLIHLYNSGRQIRRAFRNIRRTLPEIISVLVLFTLRQRGWRAFTVYHLLINLSF